MNKQLITKEIGNKLAGKETSLSPDVEHKSELSQEEVSKKTEYIAEHVEHFVLCLRDAFGFRDPMEVVSGVTKRLFKIFPNIAIEKVFKWFYGNSLGWSTNVIDDICGLPSVDALGLNSKDWYDSCKIFGGRLSQFLIRFFRRQCRHTKPESEWHRRRAAFSKAQTFLMFKKGSPQVSENLIEEADRKHKEAMSNTLKAISHKKVYKHKPIVEYSQKWKIPKVEPTITQVLWKYEGGGWGDFECDISDKMVLQKKIEHQVSIIVNKIFKPNSFKSVLRREQTLFPSSSAHSEDVASRVHGGAVNVVKDLFTPSIGELDRMTFHPRVGVITHYGVSYDVVDTLASSLLNNDFVAEPVYLREPLKVRTITKGPSIPYWFFRPIQKFLWSSLQKHKVFQLIGTPIKGELLDEMLTYANPEGKWLSGDYSAATDNLVRWLTKSIWSKICLRAGLSDSIYELGLKGLVGHKIKYADREILQQNGQLMGSPLSFPILCIANAAICLLAFDDCRRNLNKCALRINGDDCVMCYTDSERARWSLYAEFIGMSPSPGKCYYAKDWLQMNSELFVLRQNHFRQIPFINFSLAAPYLAKGGQERTIESLSQTMQDFCIGRSEKFVNIYLRRMGSFLKKKCPGLISWYLPQCLGGLGLMTSQPSGVLFTTQQLKVATLFYRNALEGKELPYKVSSIKGGKASYQLLHQLKSITRNTPIFDVDVKPLKTFWSDRFYKEKDEEALITPLLWENLLKSGKIFFEPKVQKDVLNPKILSVFQKKAKNIEPMELKQLLRFRGFKSDIPSEALESNFEPKNVFLDTLAALDKKDKEVLLSF